MKHLAVFILLGMSKAFDLPDTACHHDVKIDDNHFNLMKTHDIGNATPTEAHYDVYGNLFYVQTRFESDGIYYDAYVIKYDTLTPSKIEGLPDGQSYSIAVDKTYSDVYFGTGKGIYIYDYEFTNATLDSSSKLKLNMIFIDKDGNKFVTEQTNGIDELYLLEGEKKVPYNAVDALNEMAIDDNNNFYFIKEEKLFQLKSNLLNPNYICDIEYDGVAQIAFHNGTVFVASQEFIYFHENGINKIKTVSNIPGNVTTVAFDHKGDFMLGTRGQLIKYQKNDCYFRQ